MNEPIINRLTLSNDGRFVECWNNGNMIHTFAVVGFLADVVGQACEWLRKWSGQEPRLSKELKARLDAADSALQRMAFGEEYR